MIRITIEGDHLVARVPLAPLTERVRAWLPGGDFTPAWHLAERSGALQRQLLTAFMLGVRSAYKLGELTPQ